MCDILSFLEPAEDLKSIRQRVALLTLIIIIFIIYLILPSISKFAPTPYPYDPSCGIVAEEPKPPRDDSLKPENPLYSEWLRLAKIYVSRMNALKLDPSDTIAKADFDIAKKELDDYELKNNFRPWIPDDLRY